MPVFHAMMLKNSFPISNLIKTNILLAWKCYTDQAQRTVVEEQLRDTLSNPAVRTAMNDISKKLKSASLK